MSKESGKVSNVILMELTEPTARQMISGILDAGSQYVVFLPHVTKRMTQRKITRTQVMTCLRHGRMTEGPFRTPRGNWQFRMESLSCGEPITVGAAFEHQNNNNIIVVITTF